MNDRSITETLVQSIECVDGAVVRLVQIDDPGDHRGTTWWLVSEYPAGWTDDDVTHYSIRVSERVARLALVGLVVEHGGMS